MPPAGGRIGFNTGKLALANLVYQREDGLLDELDQSLEHLRLAGEVAVQSRLAHVQARRQRCRGNPFGAWLFQHGRQGLQDLHTPFTRFGPLADDTRRINARFAVTVTRAGLVVGHGGWGVFLFSHTLH